MKTASVSTQGDLDFNHFDFLMSEHHGTEYMGKKRADCNVRGWDCHLLGQAQRPGKARSSCFKFTALATGHGPAAHLRVACECVDWPSTFLTGEMAQKKIQISGAFWGKRKKTQTLATPGPLFYW